MAEQGYPPRRSSRQPGSGRHHGRPDAPEREARPRREWPETPWQEYDTFGPDDDAELPPWAGPAVYQARPGGTALRTRDSRDHREDLPGEGGQQEVATPGSRAIRRYGRAAQARMRRSRRRVYWWGGVAIVACIVAAGIAILVTQQGPKPRLPYVTQLQPGEYTSVPDSCDSLVSAAVLNSYLPANGRKPSQTASGGGESQCSFTVDKKPIFLVLEVTAQMYQPFAAATGNGSASQNALDNFESTEDLLAHPAKHSPLPPAQMTTLAGTGQRAYMAFQLEDVRGNDTDVVTVSILERNVLITVELQGQEHGNGFGPVSPTTLKAGARAVAKSVLAKVKAEPTAS